VHHPVGVFPVSIEHGTDFVHALAVSHPVPVPAALCANGGALRRRLLGGNNRLNSGADGRHRQASETAAARLAHKACPGGEGALGSDPPPAAVRRRPRRRRSQHQRDAPIHALARRWMRIRARSPSPAVVAYRN
jgi:hypothetical protein